MAEIFFEKFQVTGYHVGNPSVLSLFANGRTTGCVVNTGDGIMTTTPVYEGFFIPTSIQKNWVAGRAITDHFVHLLDQDGIKEQGGKGAWRQVVNAIKEKYGFVSLDVEADKAKANSGTEFERTYELPNGQSITVNDTRFVASEALFYPPQLEECEDDETMGMHQLCSATITSCNMDTRKNLYGNIILSGGTSLYEGLDARLTKEV